MNRQYRKRLSRAIDRLYLLLYVSLVLGLTAVLLDLHGLWFMIK